jgi:hypothetical protein
MKLLVLVSAVALCTAASAVAATPPTSAPFEAMVAQASCSAIPAAYRANPSKVGMWAGSCLVCKKLGPRQMARNVHLGRSDAAYVANQYATKYVQSPAFQRIASRVGGARVARGVVANGCLTGFHARGRP